MVVGLGVCEEGGYGGCELCQLEQLGRVGLHFLLGLEFLTGDGVRVGCVCCREVALRAFTS